MKGLFHLQDYEGTVPVTGLWKDCPSYRTTKRLSHLQDYEGNIPVTGLWKDCPSYKTMNGLSHLQDYEGRPNDRWLELISFCRVGAWSYLCLHKTLGYVMVLLLLLLLLLLGMGEEEGGRETDRQTENKQKRQTDRQRTNKLELEHGRFV